MAEPAWRPREPMGSVRRAPELRRDLSDAWFYIAEGSTERADSFLDAVARTIELLVASPGKRTVSRRPLSGTRPPRGRSMSSVRKRLAIDHPTTRQPNAAGVTASSPHDEGI